MQTLAAAIIPTINQAELACATPAPIAITKTASVAGTNTMILKRCANSAPTDRLTIESQIIFIAPLRGSAHFRGYVLILPVDTSLKLTPFGCSAAYSVPKSLRYANILYLIKAEFRRGTSVGGYNC